MPGKTRRLLALAEICDGGRGSAAARTADVRVQVIREWVLQFNGDGAPGLIDREASEAGPRLNDKQRRALAEIVERSPSPQPERIAPRGS